MKFKNLINSSTILTICCLFAYDMQAQDSTFNVKDSIKSYNYSTVADLQRELDDIFNDNSFRNAHWGVVIQSLNNGEYFYKRNEDKFFVPASNLKLFTSAGGLLLLGNDYRFSTNILSNGYQSGSTLYGDLIIQGRGDPTISGRFYNNDLNFVFDSWIDSLLELGIKNVKGNIVGDDNLFEDTGLGIGWSWNYETDWYAAQSGAISFNDNCVDITIKYDSRFDSIIVTYNPPLRNIVLLNRVAIAKNNERTTIDVNRERGTNVITVSGTFRKDADSIITYATVVNPTQFMIMAFKNRM